jgi:hypothetical protein
LKAVPFAVSPFSPIPAFLCVLCDLCGEGCAIPVPKTRKKSYAHKGMHMTWMEKVRNRAQKPVKTAPKT